MYRSSFLAVNPVATVLVLLLLLASAAMGQSTDGLDRARNDEARLAQVVEMVESGRLTEAAAALDEAGEVADSDPRWLNLRGLVAAGSGLHGEAVAFYEAGLRSDPTLAGLHRNLAISLVEMRVRGRAVSEFRQATELDSSDLEAWLGLCTLQTSLRRYEGAQTSLQRLIQLAPEDLRTGRARAALADADGQVPEQLAAWRWLEDRAPAADTARRLGELLSDPAERLASFRDCFGRDPAAVDCREQATSLAFVLGQPEEAVLYSEPALGQLSEAGYLNLLGAAAASSGIEKIEAWIEARRPESAAGWGLVASVRREQDRPQAALEAVQTGLGLAETADLYNLLGVLRVEAGDRPAARAAWQKALEIDPGHGPARANLEQHPATP
ncbi:hypothetical protein DRQ53_00975 [bacterium]|nr:MAG: hypothetical protein DRQ32_09725 [bacterium]RKZ18305.1 MAG: hypothetical protein DRQ53_00975 [bacterium]